jgi:hypothetical protein
MSWTENDLKNKGFQIGENNNWRREPVILNQVPDIPKSQKVKMLPKISIEKQTIELFLKQFKEKGLIEDYVTELQFDEVRKFRFDWAIPSLKIGIEYEGIMSTKSRHTTISGYSKDIEKYNLAITLGWRVLRYTAKNYKDLETDLIKLL